MNTMPVVRAAYLIPFIDFLRTIGAPVERELIRAKLPLKMSEEMADYVPVMSALSFISCCARSQGIKDIGLKVFGGMDLLASNPELLGVISNADSLKTALLSFCRLSVLEDSTINTRLVFEGDSVHICYNCTRVDILTTPEQDRISEWGQNMLIISIIRQFAGSSWHPEKMAFQSNARIDPDTKEVFPNTTIYNNRKSSWIEVPNSMLSLPQNKMDNDPGIVSKRQSEEKSLWDFTSSVEAVLPSYLCDGTPLINTMAEVVGMSVRTLQRRLGEDGTNFSELVEKARYKKSIDLLCKSDNKIIDIAYSMGYTDPSHFSRAFRRLAGVSPMQFRQQLIR